MHPDAPLISVIIPTYGAERHIDAAIDSLLGQTEQFHQIVIVNDGGTDGTASWLAKYAWRDTVRVVATANQDLGPARNAGLRFATGEYVYFMDTDTVLSPRFVAELRALIAAQRGPDLLLFSGTTSDGGDVAGAGAPTRQDALRRPVAGVFPSGLDAASALLDAGLFAPAAALYLSRRALWDVVRFKAIAQSDDEVIARLCARARLTCVSQQALCVRRIAYEATDPDGGHGPDDHFAVLESTWSAYRDAGQPEHQAFLLRRFRTQAWHYLQACRRAQITPGGAALLFLLRRFAHVPKADLWRALAPRRNPVRLRHDKRLVA
jgi:hypothetical protein